MQHTIGWDIGGAYVKAALVTQDQTITRVFLQACPLWKGVEYLHRAVNIIISTLPSAHYRHILTMTGELVDLFNSRDEGVQKIIATMQGLLNKSALYIYLGQAGFIPASHLDKKHYPFIASANWIASLSWVTQTVGEALFVDIGSTTTDIILSQHKDRVIQDHSDYQRLQSQELIYTGIVRTAVMALTQTALFKGQPIGLMAEYFATMADVYRLTGELNEAHDQTETADGQEKTQLASAKRLSRMIAYEFQTNDLTLWKQFAFTLRSYQKQQIQTACQRQLNRITPNNTILIGAGIGRFLAQHIAADLALPYQDFSHLFKNTLDHSALSIADCAPAVAIACLFLTSSYA